MRQIDVTNGEKNELKNTRITRKRTKIMSEELYRTLQSPAN